MPKVDLITGFLGAGKTTFLRHYLRYLRNQGQKVRIIENEFGPIPFDSQLLSEDCCEVEDLSGMCMCCTGKAAFIEMLRSSALQGCDRVLVEPSGIYDVDEFFDVLSSPGVADRCEIGSILTIADPVFDLQFSGEVKYLLACQLLASGALIFSKTQLAAPDAPAECLRRMDAMLQALGFAGMPDLPVYDRDWETLTGEDFRDLAEAGFSRSLHTRMQFSHAETFRTLLTRVTCGTRRELEERLANVFASPACGRVYRIKGTVCLTDEGPVAVNYTGFSGTVAPAAEPGPLAVIGQQLKEGPLRELLV